MLNAFARVVAVGSALFWTSSVLAAATAVASSPDGSISVKVESDNDGRTLYSVKDTRGDILIETRSVKKGDSLSLPIGAGGGFAIRIMAGK